MLLYSPSKCSFTLSKLIRNARFFLLAARHRMQALSALACCVGCAFSGFASLKTALFIQLLTNEGAPLILLGHPLKTPGTRAQQSFCALFRSCRATSFSLAERLSALLWGAKAPVVANIARPQWCHKQLFVQT